MNLTAAARGFVAFLLSLPGWYIYIGNDDWTVTYTSSNVCSLRGSTVDISCTFKYPEKQHDLSTTVLETLWFTKEDRNQTPVDLLSDADYTGRVESSCGEISCIGSSCNRKCTLSIRDLRQSDSAVYNFRFKTNQPGGEHTANPGVALTVTDLQVKVSPQGNNAKMECDSMCANATYIWYRNGQLVAQRKSSWVSISSEASYSCAVKGYERLRSPSVCKSTPQVSYPTRTMCVLQGTSVDISCTYSHPSNQPLNYTYWFKWRDNQEPRNLQSDSEYEGRAEYPVEETGRSTLTITDLRDTDSAEYRFTFETSKLEWKGSLHGTTLTVTDLQVKVSPRGSWTRNLECDSMCTNPTIIWYKNGEYLAQRRSYSVSINSFNSYSCAVEGYERLHSPSVCVQGNSCFRVSYPTRTMCVLQGTSVDISCTYSHPSYVQLNYKYWFEWRANQEPRDLQSDSEYEGRVEYPVEETGRSTLTITDLRVTDSAEYRFTFKTSQHEWKGSLHGTTLTVTGLRVEVTPVATVTEGQRVTLTCITSCPLADKPSYIWYQNNGSVNGLENPENQLVLDPVRPQHAGSYSCSVRNYPHLRSPEETLTVQYAPQTPSVSVSPSGEVVEGSSVTLSCSSDANPAANYTWFKEHEDSVGESGQNYTITNITSELGGHYYCQAHNAIGRHNSTLLFINVTDAPQTPSVSVSPSGEVVEGSSVTLSCSSDANPAANYTWFKEHEDSVIESGQDYTITNITSELGGHYYCQAHNAIGHHNSTLLFINVTDKSSSQTTVAVKTVAVLLVTILLLIFLCMRRKRASRKACGQRGRPDTREESLPHPEYENLPLTNRSSPAAQREPIEEQDDIHNATIHISHSEDQEVPHCSADSPVQSDQTEQITVFSFKRPNAVPE
ncbi:unnamed protein product [Merluccius merluccius]